MIRRLSTSLRRPPNHLLRLKTPGTLYCAPIPPYQPILLPFRGYTLSSGVTSPLPGTLLMARATASLRPPPEDNQAGPSLGDIPSGNSARSYAAIIGPMEAPPMIDGATLALITKEGNCITDGPHECIQVHASLPCHRCGTRHGHSPRGTLVRGCEDYFSPIGGG